MEERRCFVTSELAGQNGDMDIWTVSESGNPGINISPAERGLAPMPGFSYLLSQLLLISVEMMFI